MTKLCPRGKAAAKRKFKVYPSAYANAYASRICAGKIKDPSGVKRKDFRGSKAKGGRIGYDSGDIVGSSNVMNFNLLKEKNTISDEKGIFLDKTYRMHSNICTFISDSFYEKRLISDLSNANQIVEVCSKITKAANNQLEFIHQNYKKKYLHY